MVFLFYLNYSPQQLHDLTTGALLHDIGMVILPSAIINKPAALTDVEKTTVQDTH